VRRFVRFLSVFVQAKVAVRHDGNIEIPFPPDNKRTARPCRARHNEQAYTLCGGATLAARYAARWLFCVQEAIHKLPRNASNHTQVVGAPGRLREASLLLSCCANGELQGDHFGCSWQAFDGALSLLRP